MYTHCINSNREMIIRVLQTETGKPPVYHPSPGFAVSVGDYTILRDGRIAVEEDVHGVFAKLASMGLCDFGFSPESPGEDVIAFPIEGFNGRVPFNLMSIISSRQVLLNQALAGRNAFYIARSLMDDLIAHPPETMACFLQALYGRSAEYHGIAFSLSYIEFSGFQKCRADEAMIHKQLASRIMAVAVSKRWVKPYTANVRNRKYALRTWMNAIGMTGSNYAQARRIMLERLYGRSDQRGLPRRKED